MRRRPPVRLAGARGPVCLVALARPPSASFPSANPLTASSHRGVALGVDPGVDSIIFRIYQLIQVHMAEMEGFEPCIASDSAFKSEARPT